MKNTKVITVTRKIGSNRGSARLWLEGKILSEAGWSKGKPFSSHIEEGTLFYIHNIEGNRKVAGTETRPIIDTNTNDLLNVQAIGDKVIVQADDHMIMVWKENRPL